MTFDYNGGMGKENEKTKQVVYGDIYGEMPTPVRDGYTFYGWYCYETYGVPYTEESVVKFTKDHTLYARWMPKKYTITFDGRGGSVSEEKMVVTYDTQYASLPVSIRDGYQFMGWFTMEDGGVQLVEGGKVAVTADIKAYAHWQAMNYTLYLNANGGSVQTESKVITVGLKVGELEVPVRAGWYTALSGGSLYTGDTTISTTGDVTLYARWKKGTSSASQTTAGQVDQGQEASITISTIKMTGVKTTNYVNKALDLKKAKLIVTYSDGSKKTVTSGYKVNKYSTKAGKRKVTITYGGKQCTLTCSWYDKKAIKKIALDKSKYELYTTATKTIKLKTPYSINQAVSYKSEDSKIASVNSKGVITGKKAGKTKIIVTVNIGTQKKILTMNVVVKDPTIKGGYTFGSKWNTLKFHATLSGGNQKIVWSSSNKKIARIDKRTGKFTGLKDGTVVITAKAGNSKKTFRVLIKTKAKCIIVY